MSQKVAHYGVFFPKEALPSVLLDFACCFLPCSALWWPLGATATAWRLLCCLNPKTKLRLEERGLNVVALCNKGQGTP